ncbi:MAG: TolC family protein [Bacteroidales bacterium]
MKRIVLSSLLIPISVVSSYAQQLEVVRLTPNEIEQLFLNQNLELIAGSMNISAADAMIAQAKVWDNPSVSISNVNLWSTRNQRDGEREVIPPLIGSFAKNTEFSIELSQMITLARKRSKLVAMETVSKEIAIKQFENLLRNLKYELRKSLNQAIYLSSYYDILKAQCDAFEQIISSYKKNNHAKNIAGREIVRLQAELFGLQAEMNQIKREVNASHTAIKNALSSDPFVSLQIKNEGFPEPVSIDLTMPEIIDIASVHRPDLSIAQLNVKYQESLLRYEKAQRVPNLNLSANYDRAGGVWKDFIGFGVGMDLPLFNRNKGAIKSAQIAIDQHKTIAQQENLTAINEIKESMDNYTDLCNFYNQTKEQMLIADLSDMYKNYSKNMLNRNISILEFLDFFESYKNSSGKWLEIQKDIADNFQTIQYLLGTEIQLKK